MLAAKIETVQSPQRRWLRSFGRSRKAYMTALAHPDGRRVIAAERDGSTSVWDLHSGARVHRLVAPLSSFELEDLRGVALRLHPDGARLFVTVEISDSADVTFCWDLAEGRLVETYDYPHVPEFVLDGELAVTGHGLRLTVWELATGVDRLRLPREDSSWGLVDVTSHGSPAALVLGRAALEIWDLTRGRQRWSLPVHDVGGAVFLPTGDVLVSGHGALEIRAGADGDIVRRLTCDAFGAVAIDRHGTTAVVTGADLVAIDLETGAVRSRFSYQGEHASVQVTDDACHAVVAERWRSSAVWELATGRCRLRAEAPMVAVPGSDTAVTVERNVLRQWQLGDDVVATRAALPMNARSDIACVVRDGELELTRVADGESIAVLRTGHHYPRVLDLEPGARRIAIAAGTTLELWRGEPSERVHAFRTLTEPLCAAFEPSRRWILSGHADGSIQRWDTRMRRHDGGIETGGDAVTAIAVSPRGDRFVTTSGDAVVRGWSLEDLRPLARWDGDDPLHDLRWDNDGTIHARSDEGPVTLRWPADG